ncbi:Glycosyl transferase family 9, partial [human gut metagenome]
TNYKTKPSTEHVIKRYVEVAQLLTKAITEHANLDTSLNIDKYGIESSCLLNESNANMLYHMDFQVPTNLHSWAENQWKSIDNDVSLHRGVVETPLRIGLVLGTSWATKEWPQEKWYSLIKSLQYRAKFVCLG